MTKTGRELDALIAEKVMGLKPPYTTLLVTRSETDIGFPTYAAKESLLPYSTDISAAWEVVEKLRYQGLDVQVSTRKDGTYVDCNIFDGSTTKGSSEPWNIDDAPLAICMAALMAVGHSTSD